MSEIRGVRVDHIAWDDPVLEYKLDDEALERMRKWIEMAKERNR